MPETLPLEETKRFERDTFSKALLSKDQNGLAAYRTQRRQSEQINILEKDINTVQIELESMKRLLQDCLKNNK